MFNFISRWRSNEHRDDKINEQSLLLGLLKPWDGQCFTGITRFQKIVFITQREYEGTPVYDFNADDYGPFSQTLYEDIQSVTAADFISQTERQSSQISRNTFTEYALTDRGKSAWDNFPVEKKPYTEDVLQQVVDDHGDKDTWDLLDYVYTEYPRMVRNSELSLV